MWQPLGSLGDLGFNLGTEHSVTVSPDDWISAHLLISTSQIAVPLANSRNNTSTFFFPRYSWRDCPVCLALEM